MGATEYRLRPRSDGVSVFGESGTSPFYYLQMKKRLQANRSPEFNVSEQLISYLTISLAKNSRYPQPEQRIPAMP
jgi:hypothetical protein